MDSKEMLERERKIAFKAAEEYEMEGVIRECCPYCNGKLRYEGVGNSFCISCENQCGFEYGIRGI